MTRDALAETENCRLCGALLQKEFDLPLMSKHRVTYYSCTDCDSLQTETPYWLDEAYSESNLSYLDTGAAQRNITNLAATFITAKVLNSRKVIDHGGGDGLLCRLLRDYGLESYIRDRYAKNTYAQGFEHENSSGAGLITAFEVIEHYVQPAGDLDELFDFGPDSVLLSTACYEKQGRDWWYLTPESGQHVFFYSRKALAWVGAQRGYDVRFSGNFTIFFKRGKFSALRQYLIHLALLPIGLRLFRGLLMVLPAKGADKDFVLLTDRYK